MDTNLVYVIGKKEEIWIFQGLGVRTSFVRNVQEARESLEEAVWQKYRFVFITETYAEELFARISELTSSSNICVTVIPGMGEKKNLGFLRLRKFSERGVGVDLVSSKI